MRVGRPALELGVGLEGAALQPATATSVTSAIAMITEGKRDAVPDFAVMTSPLAGFSDADRV